MEHYRFSQYHEGKEENCQTATHEIKSSLLKIDFAQKNYPGAGLPIISDGKTAYVDNLNTHSMLFGTAGSKKTNLFLMPMINMFIKAGESFIAADPDGGLYRQSAGMAKTYGYNVIVLNLRDPEKSDGWNPLALPYRLYHEGKTDEAISMLNDLINLMAIQDMENKDYLLWSSMACSLTLANLLLLMECAKPEEANLASLAALCTFENLEPLKTNEKEMTLMGLSEKLNSCSMAGKIYKSFFFSPKESRRSIYSSLYSLINVYKIKNGLIDMLSDNTIDLNKISQEKTALYMILPNEKTHLHFLAASFIKQASETLIDMDQKEKNCVLPIRVNFVLDDFCSIPGISDMGCMISAVRNRNMNIRFFLTAPSHHQLREQYREDADTILDNCENLVFLTANEIDLLKEVSDLNDMTSAAGKNTRNPISISDLKFLDKELGAALIVYRRRYPIIYRKTDMDAYEYFKAYEAPLMKDHSREDYKIFPVKQYLKAVNEKRIPVPFAEPESCTEISASKNIQPQQNVKHESSGSSIKTLINEINKKIAEMEAEESVSDSGKTDQA